MRTAPGEVALGWLILKPPRLGERPVLNRRLLIFQERHIANILGLP